VNTILDYLILDQANMVLDSLIGIQDFIQVHQLSSRLDVHSSHFL